MKRNEFLNKYLIDIKYNLYKTLLEDADFPSFYYKAVSGLVLSDDPKYAALSTYIENVLRLGELINSRLEELVQIERKNYEKLKNFEYEFFSCKEISRKSILDRLSKILRSKDLDFRFSCYLLYSLFLLILGFGFPTVSRDKTGKIILNNEEDWIR